MWASQESETRVKEPGCGGWRARAPGPAPPSPSAAADEACGSGGFASRILGGVGGVGLWEEEPRSPTAASCGGPEAIAAAVGGGQ